MIKYNKPIGSFEAYFVQNIHRMVKDPHEFATLYVAHVEEERTAGREPLMPSVYHHQRNKAMAVEAGRMANFELGAAA